MMFDVCCANRSQDWNAESFMKYLQDFNQNKLSTNGELVTRIAALLLFEVYFEKCVHNVYTQRTHSENEFEGPNCFARKRYQRIFCAMLSAFHTSDSPSAPAHHVAYRPVLKLSLRKLLYVNLRHIPISQFSRTYTDRPCP